MFFSYTEHLRCISNMNTYGTFASTCVYYIWKAHEIWDIIIILAPIQTSENLWNQKVLRVKLFPIFFYIYIFPCDAPMHSPMQALLEDAQGILSLILHLTISGCGIDPTNEARATGEESMLCFWIPRVWSVLKKHLAKKYISSYLVTLI